MRKLIGATCVLAAVGIAIMLRMCKGRQTVRLLQGLSHALICMEGEIRLNRIPMPRLLNQTGARKGPEAAFFHTASAELQKCGSLQKAWETAARELALPEAFREQVSVLGDLLSGDEESACGGLRQVGQRLQAAADELQSQRPDRERKEAALLGTAGALLVILLI